MRMKAIAHVCIALATTAAMHASPTDATIVAAMKLSDAPNYGWSTTVDDDARSYTIDGQTNRADKDDCSLVHLPMIAALRKRTSRGSANSDNQATAIYRGDEKLVILTPDGWRKPEDLPVSSRSGYSGQNPGGGMGGFGGRRGRRGMGGMGGMGGVGPGDGTDGGNGPPPYSNLQLTLSRPHEELAIIVANFTDLKVEGELASGTLTELGAKLLLVHPGQKELTPLKAAGTFRFWIKDGAVVKYELKLEGTLAVNTSGTRREVTVHQTTTTEVKSVGSTTFDVPDDARKKLDA